MRSLARTSAALLLGLVGGTTPALVAGQAVGQSPPAVPPAPAYGVGGVALAELVAGLGNTTRVLMIAAHPDDEDNRLLAWLSRARHVETAYLSLTRGDGGQNLIGNELGEALGVIRTEELLAARRFDGAHQYFSRAYDFGFSKSAAEAFTHWPHDSLLGDVVTVVRAFRPHVIIAVFSGTPRDGHGQHQVSAILAREAYDLSGDTARFPVARFGPAWTAAKFYRDRSYFGGGPNTLPIEVGAYDPLLGVTYAEIAAVSRSQHRSQAQGSFGPAGPVTGSVYREATRVNEHTPAGQERSMFDGIDTTWTRLRPAARNARARSALDSIPAVIARVRRTLSAVAPDQALRSLVQLARLEREAAAGDDVAPDHIAGGDGGGETGHPAATDPDLEATLATARARTVRAVALAAGLEVHAVTGHDVAATGEGDAAPPVAVDVAVTNRGGADLRIDGVRWRTSASASEAGQHAAGPLPRDSTWHATTAMWAGVATQPWWLRTPRRGDLFTEPVSRQAEDLRPGPATVELRLAPAEAGPAAGAAGGSALPSDIPVDAAVVDRIADPTRGEVDRPLAFAPPVSVTLDATVEYVRAGARIDRPVRVTLRSAADSARDVAVRLDVPSGLEADSALRHVVLPPYGVRRVDFRVTGTLPAGEATLGATAESRGARFHDGYVPIDYEHIRPQRLYRPAQLRLSVTDVTVPAGLTVGYIRGVGDNVEPALEQLGLPVTMLDPAGLPTTDLSRFTTIVVGPRAYEASADLRANNARLLDFARNGGTLVVQYGQYEMTEPGMMPFPITLARPHDRVTDENAPVRVLDPASPLLTVPNRIGDADFAGWVQERSLYMPHTFDPRYHAILSMNDPGEPPNDAAILVAPLGKGTYVYTSLALFRQLPAGVPGAARLFVNLLQAGRRCCDAM